MFRHISVLEIFFYYIMLLTLVATKLTYADDLEDMKSKRGGNMGLIPFPRVGRGDPEMVNWDGLLNSMEDYADVPRYEVKRQGLIPFPRVGRSGGNVKYWPKVSLQDIVKRAGGAGANGGMWFGPRLGRIQKRNSDKDGSIQATRHDVYTPRLGRESEEILDDYDDIMEFLFPQKDLNSMS